MTEDNEKLWDALNQVMRSTGLDAKTIALKAIVPVADTEAFVEDSAHPLDDDTATRLAVFSSRAIANPLGMALAMLREAADMSLLEVERATKISQYSVSKYERGDRVPKIDALLTLWRQYRFVIGNGTAPVDMFEAVCAGELGALRAWIESTTALEVS